MRKTTILMAGVVMLLGSNVSAKDTTKANNAADTKAANTADADNTKRNVRDKDGTTLTPFDQGESASDRNISATIRKAIVGDSALSSNAHNVKIITTDGVVTLRGPVANANEKSVIEARAKSTEGVQRVNNELEITRDTRAGDAPRAH